MKRSGAVAKTPQQSRELVVKKLEQVSAGRLSPKEAARYELRVATTDARCQHHNGMARIVAVAAANEERRALRSWSDELRLLSGLRTAALDRVKQ
ncbi:hypothetical protein ACFQ7F_00720 [Streptomyces sp. NPDC056486]|uniref:hypothetical protein n=1 Tax=Streptomyces sp. NPDC056486 TaxID=3345835 RepID=UPI00368D55C6